MQLFYNPSITEKEPFFTFDRNESKHIVKVLRKRKGDEVWITDGNGLRFQAKITDDHINHCTVELLSFHKTDVPNYKLHMAVAPTKMNDRFEWFLEKATEIGVHEITPVICQRSERKTIKLDRMQRVVESAMKQSLQTYLPTLHAPVSLSTFLAHSREGLKCIAHCEESERIALKDTIVCNKNVTILIGPEGDFDISELKKAYKAGYVPVSLGTTRLRTETAALVACSIVATINED